MRIALVTDAWAPQVNGVVRTLETTAAMMRDRGHAVEIISPDRFWSVPAPTYPEIRLALARPGAIERMIDNHGCDVVHVATEGPLGLAARRHCIRTRQPFTTSFHTRFPDYVHARFRVPRSWSWKFLAWFHRPAHAVLVATPRLASELAAHGLPHSRIWSRGVDLSRFGRTHPLPDALRDLPRPILLNVGRIAVEKNLEAFLALETPGTKVVVGDGPARAELAARYPQVRFLGALFGDELAAAYAHSDLFVFPSRTDTFGLVLVEAMASGLPVAAFPVHGPLDVIGDSDAGVLSEDLGQAINEALRIPRTSARLHALGFSWDAAVDQFEAALVDCADSGKLRRRRWRARNGTADDGMSPLHNPAD